MHTFENALLDQFVRFWAVLKLLLEAVSAHVAF
jgi:hypothetical protein